MATYSSITINETSSGVRSKSPSDATAIYSTGSITFSTPRGEDESTLAFWLLDSSGSVIAGGSLGEGDPGNFGGAGTKTLAELFPGYALAGNKLKDVSGQFSFDIVDPYTACGAPTSVTINGSISAVKTAASTATLAWSGATAGTNNPIAKYVLLYSDSTDGSSWSDWFSYGETDIASTASSYSMTVNLPAVGTYRKFKVATVGTAGKDYMSGYKESPTVLRQNITACGAPTSPKVAATISRTAVDLSWGAGSAGTNNSVTGYDVQYRESSDGSTWGSWTTAGGSPVTETKLSVAPSTTAGNYRQYRVRTRGSAGSNYYSAWVTSTNTLRRKWNAFDAYTDPTLSVGDDLRAVHMTELQARIATIRSFYGMSAASFTAITGDVTLAADWADHIAEIRAAVDGVSANHDSWIAATAGEPAIAVMEQLREIINNM